MEEERRAAAAAGCEAVRNQCHGRRPEPAEPPKPAPAPDTRARKPQTPPAAKPVAKRLIRPRPGLSARLR